MSGITISTPRSSTSGNIIPASIKIMSSPARSTSMFIPNSPRPPRGIAKREGFVNAARILARDPSSYHKGTWEIGESLGVVADKSYVAGSPAGTSQRSPPRERWETVPVMMGKPREGRQIVLMHEKLALPPVLSDDAGARPFNNAKSMN